MYDIKDMVIDIVSSEIDNIVNGFGIQAEEQEKGHKYGEKCEASVIELLKSNADEYGFSVKTGKGSRGHYDFILIQDGHEYDVNIKFGHGDKYGQPNVCAMNRIIDNFICNEEKLDTGYWLLKIKVYDDGTIDVHLVNLFDIVDYLHYDMGTGQIMLKEKDFYEYYNDETDDIQSVILKLYDLYDRQTKKHIELKQKQRNKYIKKIRQAIDE